MYPPCVAQQTSPWLHPLGSLGSQTQFSSGQTTGVSRHWPAPPQYPPQQPGQALFQPQVDGQASRFATQPPG
jgi:hypothetical protein